MAGEGAGALGPPWLVLPNRMGSAHDLQPLTHPRRCSEQLYGGSIINVVLKNQALQGTRETDEKEASACSGQAEASELFTDAAKKAQLGLGAWLEHGVTG